MRDGVLDAGPEPAEPRLYAVRRTGHHDPKGASRTMLVVAVLVALAVAGAAVAGARRSQVVASRDRDDAG
jgi:hypothetical protein